MSDDTIAEREPNDIRPVIATGSQSNWGIYGFIALLVIGGAVLFNALNSSRQASDAPATAQTAGSAAGRISSPEPLSVPDRFLEAAEERVVAASPAPIGLTPAPANLPPVRLTQVTERASELPAIPPPQMPEFLPEPPRSSVVFENRAPLPAAETPAPVASNGLRVTAKRLANPSLTIPQGTVILAVLETALDSTRAGGARALVQRDVLGFDGTRVLIPRGSRLYGEYNADLRPGQNRALVQWTRLIRPDGVTIALDSPSSDPLGRAGVRGKVDSKFFQRFGNALLQTVLDVGVGLAASQATDGVIVALPGSTQNVRVSEEQTIQRSLKVKHGTSVSVFVARDLDFSSVDS
ncbi:MAG: TrbI/VirB10 family protein [Pseudomonadota bacterium]